MKSEYITASCTRFIVYIIQLECTTAQNTNRPIEYLRFKNSKFIMVSITTYCNARANN